jgi:hypothetical protein
MAVVAAPTYVDQAAAAIRATPAKHARRWGAPIWQADEPIDQPERPGQTQPSLHLATLAIMYSKKSE